MTFNFEVGDGAHALDPQHLLDYTRGWQVIDAAGGSNLVDDNATTGTVIRAAAGDINAGGSTVTCAQETVDLAADVDPDDPRKVTVYRTPAGALETAAGTPTAAQPSGATRRQAGEPAPPTLSGTDGVILASVWLAAGTASVTNADIRDRRLAAELPLEALTTDRAVFDDQSSAPSGVTDARVLYASASDGNFYKVNPNGTEEQIGGTALSDSGTDTDGGNDYVLPQAADNIDLQSSGGLRNADVVSTEDLDIGGSDAADSGDFLAWGPTFIQNGSFSTTSTSYVQVDTFENRVQWDAWAPANAQTAVFMTVRVTDSIGDVRVFNPDDGATVIEASNVDPTTNNGKVTVGPVNYTPSNTSGSDLYRLELKTDDGGTQSTVSTTTFQMGIQV